MTTQHQVNQQQYQDKSQAYLNSHVHAQGVEFQKIQQLIQSHQFQKVLDLGCGGGHVTYQVAALVDEVVAYDLTPSIVELVSIQAKQRDLQSKASEQVQRYYQIKADGSFSSEVAYIVLSK